MKFWRRRAEPSMSTMTTIMLDPVLAGSAPSLRASRKKVRWFAVAGMVGGAVIGSVAFAPAAWLATAVAGATDGRLLLADARGTVWSGDAVTVLTDGPDGRHAMALPDRLHWEIGRVGLGLGLRLRQACCLQGEPTLQLSGGLSGWQVDLRPDASPKGTAEPAAPDTTEAETPARTPSPGPASPPAPPAGPGLIQQRIGQVPAAWLAGLGTPWNTLQLEGQIVLSTPGLTLSSSAGRWRLDGSAVLDVQHLSSRLSTLPELGTYRLNLTSQASGPRLNLITLDGALRLGGGGEWLPSGWRFRGEASAEAGSEAVLANLLNIIGRRQGARSLIAIG